MDYGFKIIAKVKDNLSQEEKVKILEKINDLKNKLDIYQLDDITYIRLRKNNRDLGAACLFYIQLEKVKGDFSKLEYHDYINDEMEIAV
ncbi:hypothetical protein FL857_01600 [Criibacterium bergeronii]|uniref:Uncharacterized protein n=1 Tax=Criibacterium bergeronii TaxID=1871336 RepID=A0A552VCH7_9FIRM|nr:hypothetical protein [Criibacterium bergeronii]TRW28187.1 hypothetical protein FL857_01600 [Criibacterium bergeronii]